MTDPHIISEKRGALGLLTLARPQALNALTHGMIRAIAARLAEWAADDAVRAVAIRGEGRGFCAGGDIRVVQQAAAAGSDEGAALLRDEYRMNALIGAYPKPYITLIHGICMGGGAGLSVHGSHRLADSSLGFAMPETAIGFVPDIGSSHFLSRAPGEIGMYLGLTAERIGLGDALEAGFVSHAVNAADFEAVIAALAKGESVARAIAPFVRKAPPGALTPYRRQIETIFSASSVEAILERLDRDGSDFARRTAQMIRSRSPTSLKIVFRQLRTAAKLDLKQCLAMELRLALRVLPGHDFREGVRAALVDKDRTPRWQPSALAGVGDIEPYFAPLQDDLF
ncbi:MAG: enoyl-CoA hydratase/isomerase family protein [Alphaproteobacteria bacterium]|nr:enoyl-CoA hydratase/isomerase family protein [Alphaproteobacteria bacterium]